MDVYIIEKKWKRMIFFIKKIFSSSQYVVEISCTLKFFLVQPRVLANFQANKCMDNRLLETK